MDVAGWEDFDEDILGGTSEHDSEARANIDLNESNLQGVVTEGRPKDGFHLSVSRSVFQRAKRNKG